MRAQWRNDFYGAYLAALLAEAAREADRAQPPDVDEA
jgi:hypothetical protein